MSTHRDILIVEDSKETVAFISEILEGNEYPYSVANTGAEAIETMKEKRPDLVLLDIMMPRKSGMVVFQHMKNTPELMDIPIVFVTGASEITGVDLKTGEQQPKKTYADDFARGIGTKLAEKMRSFEPDGFIYKPIDPEILVTKLKELLP
jgi:CheY-like chemotaxis protein